MSPADAYIELMTNNESPFSYIETYSMFDVGSLLSNLLKFLWMAIGRMLDGFVSAMESFANSCYNFLSFSSNSAFTSLYDVINKFITIPLAICLLIIAFKYVTGDINKTKNKQYLNNILIVFFVLCVMPSIFSYINKDIIGSDFLKTVGNNHLSTSNTILRGNTTDFLYLYQESGKLKAAFPVDKEPNDASNAGINTDTIIQELKQLQQDYPNSSFAQNISFDSYRFDINQTLKQGENEYTCPKFYQVKCIGKQVKVDSYSNEGTAKLNLYTIIPIDTNGFFGTGLGAVAYQRYNINFLNVYLQLIATAIMYFCIGYSVLKLIFELLIHQLFGPVMAATDLTGGQRIKKYLSAILGCYLGLIVSAIIVLLYNKAVATIPNTNPLIKSMMMLSLAIIFLDGPNIIAKYFGVNTGIRGGMAMAGMAMMKASRMAAAPIKAAANAGGRAINRAYSERRQNDRDNQRRAENQQREAQRRSENQQREERRQAENQQREAQRQSENRQREEQRQAQRQQEKNERYNRDMDNFSRKHGSEGNFERYQNPVKYDPNKPGSEDNLNHLKGKAAMASAYSDMNGTPAKKDACISDAVSGTKGISEQDKKSAEKISNADIKDAKQGIYTGVAKQAEAAGGKKSDYMKAAESAINAYNSAPATETAKKSFQSYIADASMNAAHSGEIREQAKNYKALDPSMSDIDCYKKAMVNGNYGFDAANIELIAKAELEQYGSLRSGNIYDSRPVKPMAPDTGSYDEAPRNTRQTNTQTRGLAPYSGSSDKK